MRSGIACDRVRGRALLLTTMVFVWLALTMLLGAAPANAAPAAGQADELLALLAVQQAQLTAADGAATDYFGYSVAVSGDTAVVGSPYDDVGANTFQGSAYVFTRSGSTWSQQVRLIAADGAAGDRFGSSVAISGDTAVVGSPYDDVGANVNQGSAYVFTRSGSFWSQQVRLTAADGAADDRFGYSVAISGDTAVVGAIYDDVGANVNQGSAYVFTRSGSTWSQQVRLIAADGAASDYFGLSVAVSGDTAVVGSYSDDVGGNANQGSAYVFTRSGSFWSQQARLTAADGAAGDFFGSSVAVSGDTAVVGAHWDDVGANANQGSAYVFTRSGNSWTQQAQLIAADGAASDYFGYSVAVSGDTAVVGSPYDDIGGNANQGSAYVFTRSGSFWSQQVRLIAADGAAHDYFGYSVAVSGDTAVVGSYSDDVGGNANQGSAYVFTRSGNSWTQQAQLTAADGAAGDNFGLSVAVSGDSAVVGAFADDVGGNADQGSAYVFTRSGSTWSQQQKLTAADGAANDLFGSSVAVSGDTAVVGSYSDDVGANADQGSAYVFTGVMAKPRKPVAMAPKGLINSRTPTFKWGAAMGAARYEVRVYKGSQLIRKKTAVTKLSWKCTKQLPRGVRLSWKVRAVNVAGAGAWSGRLLFRVR